ncbi:uncharacterized protein PV06_03782 [Exophiala oligosperma]|uniref:Uncharacterized protein n=1 Tax=Exophiala oligosperma TaxID=215243 RepID=A0A0D2DSE8_9EURO|nr:uncharacterized protein PV06_03782 [Exophiala oligosperma]KIW45385.1 hypothetical protein PV06_03782 [Exophiala oligosperma]
MTIISTPSLDPPFTKENAIPFPPRSDSPYSTNILKSNQPESPATHTLSARLPATYHSHEDLSSNVRLKRVNPAVAGSVYEYLQNSLDVSRLNEIESLLWTVGLPKIARPLHRQLSKGRTIVLTEQADCHLVWHDTKILIKPLPEILLDHQAWEIYLNESNQTRRAACGFLLSYLWLISEQSDFQIAKAHNLLPAFVDWVAWTDFASSVYDHLHDTDTGIVKVPVSPRYWYGELRLSRLNKICRFFVALPRGDFKTLLFGYTYTYTTYQSFFERNTAWLVSLVVYIGVVLTAMQVGLTTTQLRDDSRFNLACYIFTVFSILSPLIVLGGGVLTLLVLFLFHAKYAIRRHREHTVECRRLQKES